VGSAVLSDAAGSVVLTGPVPSVAFTGAAASASSTGVAASASSTGAATLIAIGAEAAATGAAASVDFAATGAEAPGDAAEPADSAARAASTGAAGGMAFRGAAGSGCARVPEAPFADSPDRTAFAGAGSEPPAAGSAAFTGDVIGRLAKGGHAVGGAVGAPLPCPAALSAADTGCTSIGFVGSSASGWAIGCVRAFASTVPGPSGSAASAIRSLLSGPDRRSGH
jgi:hypothetical protein